MLYFHVQVLDVAQIDGKLVKQRRIPARKYPIDVFIYDGKLKDANC
jgi:hypothetical protein